MKRILEINRNGTTLSGEVKDLRCGDMFRVVNETYENGKWLNAVSDPYQIKGGIGNIQYFIEPETKGT